MCPYVSNFERFSLTIARWLTHVYDEDNPAESSTNPGDVALPGGLSPHEAQYFPADVHRFAGAGVGAWPFAEQPGSDDYEMFPTGVPLTARELDVLQQLSGGHSREQIAQSQYTR